MDSGSNKNGALLKVQIGPVQDFIAQARSTLDLWSGSYLLSWLTAHAVKSVARACGEKNLIFPSAERQPLLEWLESQPSSPNGSAAILTPNLPNVFLAAVPHGLSAEDVARAAAASFMTEWLKVSGAVAGFFNSCGASLGPKANDRWKWQIENFWQITWQAWPLLDGDDLNRVLEIQPMAISGRARTGRWSANYHLASHRLDARRQTRDFAAWQSFGSGHKDFFSGKEEVVADSAWLENAQKAAELRHLFKNDDELGAVNLIKRVWHRSYLEHKKKFARDNFKIPSVPEIAAAPWQKDLRQRLLNAEADPKFETAFAEFMLAARDARHLIDPEIGDSIPTKDVSYQEWIDLVEPAVYNSAAWEARVDGKEEKELLKRAFKALDRFISIGGIGRPCRYYAVLALDGDQMGKWLSGGMTNQAVDEDFHHEFSRALSGFALHDARRIVTDCNGVLIFAGGDDVLAILPATEAIACAQELARAFRGIQIRGRHLTASAGLAIGHVKEPLQDMIDEARKAEKRAKNDPERKVWDRRKAAFVWKMGSGCNRNALAVTLFKRSGETLEWGAKFDSAAFPLLSELQECSRSPVEAPDKKMPISGKFPHRIAELLGRYAPLDKPAEPLNSSLCDIAARELSWVIQQQTWSEEQALREGSNFRREPFGKLCRDYLNDLRNFKWSRDGEEKPMADAPRSLRDFINLFLVEAFIARQVE